MGPSETEAEAHSFLCPDLAERKDLGGYRCCGKHWQIIKAEGGGCLIIYYIKTGSFSLGHLITCCMCPPRGPGILNMSNGCCQPSCPDTFSLGYHPSQKPGNPQRLLLLFTSYQTLKSLLPQHPFSPSRLGLEMTLSATSCLHFWSPLSLTGLTGSRPVLSSRTFSDNGNVLCLCYSGG